MNYIKHILVAIFIAKSSFAQQYNFKNYTVKNGLAGSIVNNIFQDSKGYIWFATQGGGVSRFDGKKFKNYSKKQGLISNDVTFITEDKVGNVWIATLEGVSKFDGLLFTNYGKSNGLGEKGVYWIYVDDQNKIWFAVREGGVNVFDGNTFNSYTTKNGLSSNDVFSITQDKGGNYWFGLTNGISKFDGKKITNFTEGTQFTNKTFFSSLLDSHGNIWFGCASGEVVKYDGSKFHSIELPELVKNDFIGSIAEDKKGNIWFATDHGVLKYTAGHFKLFTEKQGLSSNGVFSVEADDEGNIWIGTNTGGVNLFNNEAFINYGPKDGLTNKNNNCVLSFNNNDVLVGTSGTGINVYNNDKQQFSALVGIPEINEQNINTIATDKEGNYWVGADDGIFVIKNYENKFKLINKYEFVDSQRVKTITKIICDKSGAMWCSSYASGIFVFKDGKGKNFSKANGLPSDDNITVFEDSKSTIWIGTKDAGLVKYNGSEFINYNEKNGLVDKSIWSITGDENNILYLGTGENGLVIYDGTVFKTINTSNGLISNLVRSLQYDSSDKSIWLGTDKGINKIKFNSKFEIDNLQSYSEQEGFKGDEVSLNGIYIDKNGLVWFGSTNGLSRYDRRYDTPNLTPPKLQISEIRLAYQITDWKKYSKKINPFTGLPENLELSHKNNNLTFDFQALTTNNVKYTFMLEGQDEEWSPLSEKTEASFPNISSGKKYTFKVKAINSNGVWSKDVVEYSFIINPPWWQTWWFYALAILIVLGSVIGFVNYRTSHLEKAKKILEEKVEVRTLELKVTNDKLSHAFKDIKDSINYAKRIQEAILPIEQEIKMSFPKSFVLFKPRDVVSGDFYWFHKKNNLIYFAAVDCTGHGVPGAFMSMIGNSSLNEIVNTNENIDAATTLKKLHQEIRKSLKQDRESAESKDGMDISLVVIDSVKNKLQYAGAKRPLYYIRDNNFTEIKANKQSIGGIEMEDHYQFTNHDIDIQKNDCYYMFTDGYVDQFGGEKGKKYSSKRLRESLQAIHKLPMLEQGSRLTQEIENWHTNMEQIDDILVIGIQL